MFALTLICVFVGFGFIALASLTGSVVWAWISVGASVAAAAVLVTDWSRRWRTVGDGDRIGLRPPGVPEPPSLGASPAPQRAGDEDAAATEVFPSPLVPAPAVRPVEPHGPSVVEPTNSADDTNVETSETSETPETPETSETSETGDEVGVEQADPVALAALDGSDAEVFVVDEQPRYHLAGCRTLDGHESVSLPAKEAVEHEFTPCGVCTPVHVLAGSGAKVPDRG